MSMFLRFKFQSPYQCLLLVGRKWFRNWRNFQMGQKRYFFSLHTLESRTTRQPFYRRRLYYPRASGQLPLERSGMYCEESIHLWIIVSRCLHISYTSFLFIMINYQYKMFDWNLNKKFIFWRYKMCLLANFGFILSQHLMFLILPIYFSLCFIFLLTELMEQ